MVHLHVFSWRAAGGDVGTKKGREQGAGSREHSEEGEEAKGEAQGLRLKA